jgi:flagellar hook protein FlgE
MSVNGALFAGVSGLKAESSTLGVISNNIANANTVGYKAGAGEFETLVTDSGSGGAGFSPGGVLAKPVQMIDQQGLLQATSSSTDVGITGRGFFVVANSLTATGTIASTTPRDFTRAGSFTLDKSGNLVNTSGFFLLGVPTDTKGNPVTANPIVANLQPVNVGTLTGIAKGTSELSLGANLPAVPSSPSHLKLSGTLDGINSYLDPNHYVLTGSNGQQYDAQIYYHQSSATTYDLQLFNVTAIGSSSPVDTTKSPMPVTIGTATLTASGATIAGGTSVTMQDGTTLGPVLDGSGLKLGTIDAIDRAGVDAQDVTTTVYDSLGVAHSLSLEFSRAQDVLATGALRALPSSVSNIVTLTGALPAAAAGQTFTQTVYSTNGSAYFATFTVNKASAGFVSTVDMTSLKPVGNGALPTTALPALAFGSIDASVAPPKFVPAAGPPPPFTFSDGTTLAVPATFYNVSGLSVAASGALNAPTTISTQTVSPAGTNEWTAVIRNMTIAATGAPSVVFPAGSGFPINLDGSPTLDMSAAAGGPVPYISLTGNVTVPAAFPTTVTLPNSYRIVGSDGAEYNATVDLKFASAVSADLEIASLTPIDNAPATTAVFPLKLGTLTFAAGAATVFATAGASPFTVPISGTGNLTLTTNAVNFAGLTDNAAAQTVKTNIQNLGLAGPPPKTTILTFNPDGTIAAGAPSTIPSLNLATGAKPFGGATFTLNLGAANTAGGLTQFTDQFAVSFLNQDGVRFGFRTGVSFAANGLVSAVFDNGQQIPLFKVPLVNFANVNQLQAISGDVFGQTTDSGDPVPNFPGVGGTGTLTPSTLEQSTVDLSTEFANLIVTQRSFSADAKTITTSDSMLQELIDIKR